MIMVVGAGTGDCCGSFLFGLCCCISLTRGNGTGGVLFDWNRDSGSRSRDGFLRNCEARQ